MGCNKIPYPTKSAALADARLIKINHRRMSRKYRHKHKTGKQQHPYKCRFCDQCHLTSQKQKKK